MAAPKRSSARPSARTAAARLSSSPPRLAWSGTLPACSRTRRRRGFAESWKTACAAWARTTSTSTRCTGRIRALPIAETAALLAEFQREGKVRALGVSNFSVAQMEEFRSVAPLASNQPPYNLFERQIDDAILPWCAANGVAVLTWSTLCRSLLAGRVMRGMNFDAGHSQRRPQVPGAALQPVHDCRGAARRLCAGALRQVRAGIGRPLGPPHGRCGASRCRRR